jgi:chemotaxis protein MotA
VFGGFVMAGGHVASLFQPLELLMIGGAALGAFVVANSGKAIKATLKALPTCLQGVALHQGALHRTSAGHALRILAKVRKEGLMSIENDVENPGGRARSSRSTR